MARNPGCGETFRESFARYDHATSSWKTWQACFIEEWTEFSETWPKAGMMRSGKAYRAASLVQTISAREYGFLPTPRYTDGKGQYVATLRTARKRVGKSLAGSFRAHWIHVVLVLRQLNKGWANPLFSEYLMGFPRNWSRLDSEVSETVQTRDVPGG